MTVEEQVPLAPFTTFHIGGPARFFIDADSEEGIDEARAFARDKQLPLYFLSGGSNLLVPDEGVVGVVVRPMLRDSALVKDDAGTFLIADAGALWNDVVDLAGTHGLFGIENLAGIPGTAGGAAVQNIGAYGTELSSVFLYADVIDLATGEHKRIDRADAAFGYRSSVFKKQRAWFILRIALRLSPHASPNISYPDLLRLREAGEPLATPAEIARAVRDIRAGKFPQSAAEGTAGSFFKNPVVTEVRADALRARYAGLPAFPQANGTVKVPLAWVLDRVLSLKGYAKGPVRLYEKQPLVIVASAGALARDVDALAREVEERVHEATGIAVEREVETFSENFSA